jgi:hypothetical protein
MHWWQQGVYLFCNGQTGRLEHLLRRFTHVDLFHVLFSKAVVNLSIKFLILNILTVRWFLYYRVLTLSLLMSYISGAPCKARNFNVICTGCFTTLCHNCSRWNRTHVYMNFFDHKDLGNHLLKLCHKVVKHPVYGPTYGKAESRLFLFAAPCFKTESMQKASLCHSCV